MKDNQEKWYESRITFTIFTMGIAVSCVLFVIIPMYQMKTDIAVLQLGVTKIETNELVHLKAQADKNEIDHTAMFVELQKIEDKLGVSK